jgi:dihydroneopterin aldolase
MKINRSYIYLNNVSFYSYHGVAEQERIIGNNYELTLRLSVDLEKAMKSDNVEDTVNYALVHKALAEEMAIPSKLLEHVCGRIIKKLFLEFPAIDEIKIKLSKRNPPMGADIETAGVELRVKR